MNLQPIRVLFVLPAALAFSVGCSGGASTPTDAGTGDSGSPDASISGNPDASVGNFTLKLVGPTATVDAGYATLVGKVFDGPAPQLLIWEKAAESGSCQLLKPRVPFCMTSCGGSAACVESNTCQSYPVAKSAGTVTVKGVKTTTGTTEFTMSPVANTYQPVADLAYDAFAEGATVRLEAAGAAIPAFTVEAKGITPLTINNASIPLAANTALTLTWPAAQAATGSRVHVKLDVSHHGGSKGKIECDAPDTGSVELGANLVTQLLALGVAGFPTIIVTRQTTGFAALPFGKVALDITSEVESSVTIAGLVSCTDNAQCTAPATCQSDLTCK